MAPAGHCVAAGHALPLHNAAGTGLYAATPRPRNGLKFVNYPIRYTGKVDKFSHSRRAPSGLSAAIPGAGSRTAFGNSATITNHHCDVTVIARRIRDEAI